MMPLVRRTAIFVLLILAGALLGFVAGFNFHAAKQVHYTSGFTARPDFIAGLVRAFLAVKQRKSLLAEVDSLDAELLEDLRRLRIGIYRPASNYQIPVYDGLEQLGLDLGLVIPGTSSTEILKTYDVLLFPQGGYRISQFPSGERERLRNAVSGGLGYIGICAGMIFAARDLGIVQATWKPLALVGLVPVRTVNGSFWGQLGGRSFRMHFAAGGYFVPEGVGNWEPLIVADNLGVLAIAGRFGKGRVILFTAHPEGGGLTLNNQSVYFSGRDLRTGPLLLHTILKAAPKEFPSLRSHVVP